MASPTQWTWVWVNSGSWWWTGRPVVLQSMGSQRVRHNWATELNWTELIIAQLTLLDLSEQPYLSWLTQAWIKEDQGRVKTFLSNDEFVKSKCRSTIPNLTSSSPSAFQYSTFYRFQKCNIPSVSCNTVILQQCPGQHLARTQISEVSQKEKNRYPIFSHTCGIYKNGTDEPICRQERQHRCREQPRGHGRQQGEKGGVGWIGRLTCTLLILCIKYITNENLLYSTGTSTQCSVVTWMRRKFKTEGIYVYI